MRDGDGVSGAAATWANALSGLRESRRQAMRPRMTTPLPVSATRPGELQQELPRQPHDKLSLTGRFVNVASV